MHMRLFWSVFAVLAMVGFSAPALALGITPTLISFSDGERFKDVTLINTSEETKTYEMSWKFFEMQETGTSYKEIEESLTEFDVSEFVFYTPRRITIPAKGSQKIRMAFRRPSEVPPGDYHAHLLFSPADNPEIDEGTTQSQSAAAGVSVRVGYSIPVVIRAGAFEEKGSIGQIAMRRTGTNKLTVDVPVIRNEGNHALIAKLEAYHINGGEEELVGEVVNAHVFTEVDQRIVPVTLKDEIQGGSLKIVLKSVESGNDTIFDEETFPLN